MNDGDRRPGESIHDHIKRTVAPAPPWLVARMDAIRNSPPPTIEQVQRQFAACRRIRHERRDHMKKVAREIRADEPDEKDLGVCGA